MDALDDPDLPRRAVPLPEAETLAAIHFRQQRFGRRRAEDGRVVKFNPEILLVKFHSLPRAAVLRVEPRREWEAVQRLSRRADVAFVELDRFLERQFMPSDTLLSSQWHHSVINSFAAWEVSLGRPSVRIAMVDTPFQMDHPDLAAHTDAGWDVTAESGGAVIANSAGIDHSTLGAGLAAAVIDNQLGVAGAGNCRVLPININGAISEMAEAILWAADHGVRVVNISWEGADSPTLNDAGYELKTRARGILAMAGVNGSGFLNYPNQPHIYCISMTDAADNLRSRYGSHIDFAAPGYSIFSTTTNNSYSAGTGTSYATPLFCGMAAVLMSINPNLGPEEIIGLLQATARDLGPPGWDQFYGWGRIDFGAAARAAAATLPAITGIHRQDGAMVISAALKPGDRYRLLRAGELGAANWLPVLNALLVTNGSILQFADPQPAAPQGFYRLEAAAITE